MYLTLNSQMSKSKILLVEDEESIAEVVSFNLELEGYAISWVSDGRDVLQTFGEETYDLVILDVMLPGIDGYELCKQIRSKDVNVPILFLTARSTPDDIVHGLRIGGDDYLVKPFNLEEFLLRVSKLLLRAGKGKDTVLSSSYSIGAGTINFDSYQGTSESGEVEDFSLNELAVLRMLIENKNTALSRVDIINRIWGPDAPTSNRTIDNFILKFRKHFEPDAKNPTHFKSVRGVGYMLSF